MATLFTIGYAGASQQSVMQTLLDHEIQTLLDIRETPLSRKPGLSKKGLIAACAQYGLTYDHIRELGTPRNVRYRRKIDHDFEAFREGFLEYLATQEEAVDRLAERASRERCCLLCYEADAAECHRWFVAERARELSAGALEIEHLSVSIE